MLRWRILTALVLIPLVCSVLLRLGSDWVALAVGIVVFLSALEWVKMTGPVRWVRYIGFLGGMAVLIVFGYLIVENYFSQSVLLLKWIMMLSGIGWLMACITIAIYPKYLFPSFKFRSKLLPLIGFWLLWPLWLSLFDLHARVEFGGQWILLLCFIVWGADTGAYFTGRFFGRRKLAPRISPKKTLEGFAGAFLFGLLSFWIAIAIFGFTVTHPVLWSLFVILIVFVSVVGDLFESMFKRRQKVKDSGSILPGHGGFLDRIDSLTAAAPIFWLGFQWLDWGVV